MGNLSSKLFGESPVAPGHGFGGFMDNLFSSIKDGGFDNDAAIDHLGLQNQGQQQQGQQTGLLPSTSTAPPQPNTGGGIDILRHLLERIQTKNV